MQKRYKKFLLALLIVFFSGDSAYSDMIIGVTSEKPIKKEPVKRVFEKVFGPKVILAEFKGRSNVPTQPVSREVGKQGANNRLTDAKNKARSEGRLNQILCWVSTENFIEDPNNLDAQDFTEDPEHPTSLYWDDRAAIVVECPFAHVDSTTFSEPAPLPIKYVILARAGGVEVGGFSKTSGEVVHAEFDDLPADNWHIGAGFLAGLPTLVKGIGTSRDILIERALSPIIEQIRMSGVLRGRL